MEQLDRLLAYLEENIDLEHVKKVEKLHCDVLNYREVPVLPLSILIRPDDSFKPFLYSEAFEDPEKMLFNELLWSFASVYNSVRLKDYHPLHIRSNLGVGIIPSLFGAKCRIVNENMPWVENFDKDEDISRIIETGVPDINTGLGAKVIQHYKYFHDRLKEYPKCYEGIHISQPDLQGPFDIAHLLIGAKIFYMLYDAPDVIHRLLEIITKTYMKFRKKIEPLLTDQAGENNVYVHGAIYGGKVVIKDDTATINLSEDMYEEFSMSYNRQILMEFNGGCIHHCGQGRTWHHKSMKCKWLKGINFGNPESHDIQNEYENWSRERVPIIWWGYNQNKDFLKRVYDLNIRTGISLAVSVGSIEEGIEVLKRHDQSFS